MGERPQGGDRSLARESRDGKTLEPGDAISTGTSSGQAFARDPPSSLETGEVVEVRMEGIGAMRNRAEADR